MEVEPILWLHTNQMVAGIKLFALCVTIELAPQGTARTPAWPASSPSTPPPPM